MSDNSSCPIMWIKETLRIRYLTVMYNVKFSKMLPKHIHLLIDLSGGLNLLLDNKVSVQKHNML